MVFSLLWNTDHLISVLIDFPLPAKRDSPPADADFDYSHANWNGILLEGLSNLDAAFDISEFHDYAKVVSHV